MALYITRRLLAILPTIFGVSIAVFLLLQLIPGTIIEQMLGMDGGNQQATEALRQFFGLDRPLYQQYFHWAGRLIVGDFGTSWRSGEAILPILSEAFIVTLELTVLAVIVSIVVGVPLGILAALRPYGIIDSILRIVSLAGVSIPVFFQGSLLILLLSLYSPWSPPIVFDYPWDSLSNNLQIMILPAIALGIASSAVIMRMTRSSLLEVLGQDFIRTARSKGFQERVVIFKHALRNVLISVVTAIGLQFGQILGGVVVIEVVFNIPGIGQTVFNALLQRDFPVVQAGILMITVATMLVNTLVDIIYGFIDPRVRYD